MALNSDLPHMKNIRIFPFLFICLLTALMSCESDVENMESLQVASKLVVTSYISPQDTLLTVRLQKSQPAIGKVMTEEQRKVKSATVTISNGRSVVALGYNPATDSYEADAKVWPIVAGETYHLVVVTSDGIRAEASCTVPETTDIMITDINAVSRIEENGWSGPVQKYSITLEWLDAPDVTNYYRTLAYKEYTIADSYGNTHTYKDELYFVNGASGLKNDVRTAAGLLVSDKMEYYQYGDLPTSGPTLIHAILVVSDRPYYLYHESLQKQASFDGNPFAEPSVMYTNIEGGIGVFGGYNQLEAVEEL